MSLTNNSSLLSDLVTARQVISVGSASELMQTLLSANGGEVISLRPGDYGNLTLQDVQFNSHVAIVSEQQDSNSVFTSMKLINVENLVFDGVTFDYSAAPDAYAFHRPFTIDKSSNIEIHNSKFDGDIARSSDPSQDGFATGTGLVVRDSDSVTVSANEFSEWYRGAFFKNSTNIEIEHNEVHSIRSDGFNFSNIDQAKIHDNYFHDFRTAQSTDDHADMLQFWTVGTTSPSTNIHIKGNVFDIGGGDLTQTILIGNEAVRAGAGSEWQHSNFVIEDNLIHNAQKHGISVYSIAGVTIANNVLVSSLSTTEKSHIPQIWISPDSSGVSITGNTTHNIVAPHDSFVNSNVIIQSSDSNADDYSGLIDINGLIQSKLLGQLVETTEHSTPVILPAPDQSRVEELDPPKIEIKDSFIVVVDPASVDPSEDDGNSTVAGIGNDYLLPRAPDTLTLESKVPELNVTFNPDLTKFLSISGDETDNRISNTTGDSIFSGGGGGDRFSFHGARFEANEVNIFADLNFDEGDTIGFSGFSTGYFAEINIKIKTFAQDSGLVLYSIDDLIALSEHSLVQTSLGSNGGIMLSIGGDSGMMLDFPTVTASLFETEISLISVDPIISQPIEPLYMPTDRVDGSDSADRLLDTRGDTFLSGGAGADRYSFYRDRSDDAEKNYIADLDFSEGDTIALAGFSSGFFSSAHSSINVFKGGSALILDSASDIGHLSALDGVTLTEHSQGLILDVVDQIGSQYILAGIELTDL